MLYELIVIGDVLFWTLALFASLLVVFLVANDSGTGATVVSALTAAVLVLFSNATAPELTFSTLLLYTGGYFLAGSAWALVKWAVFLRRVRAMVLVEQSKGTDKLEILRSLRYQFDVREFPPSPSDQAGTIWTWLFYWPASVIADASHKPALAIYSFISTILTRISRSVFADVRL